MELVLFIGVNLIIIHGPTQMASQHDIYITVVRQCLLAYKGVRIIVVPSTENTVKCVGYRKRTKQSAQI